MLGSQTKLHLFCCIGLLGALHAGCSDDDDTKNRADAGGTAFDAGIDASARPDGATDATVVVPVVDAAVQLNEAQVVGVAGAINAGEIEAGTLAQATAVTPQARAFAETMVTMHNMARTRQEALGIAPAPSSVQAGVISAAAAALATLKSTPPGPAFDLAYLQSQAMLHTTALQLFDEVLLRNATTPALRSELTRTRGEVEAHLTEAMKILLGELDGGLLDGDAGTDAGSDAGRDAGADAGL